MSKFQWMLLSVAFWGALIIACFINSGAARADGNSYLAAMDAAGYNAYNPDAGWLSYGYSICSLEANNVPKFAIVTKIVATTGSGIYSADAYEIINIANAHLCQGASIA